MAPTILESPRPAKRKLLDDSDSDAGSDGGVKLQVNKAYAKRFEYNKKREELQQLEEKYKKSKAGGDEEDDGDDDEDDSEEETEDDDGVLITANLDAQISETLQAIRNKDPRVYDKSTTFFANDETAGVAGGAREKKAKPVYLKDYHRERLLNGEANASDDENDEDGGGRPQTEWEEQTALKKSFISEVDAAMRDGSDDQSDDGENFIKRKKGAKAAVETEPVSGAVHPERAQKIKQRNQGVKRITDLDVANADNNPELFLSNFMAARAWVPADGSRWKAFESDDDDDAASNLDRADEIETAYNLRFEDPSKTNEVLTTYSRNVADAKSVRRELPTGRQRQRELERERKEAEREQRREEKARFRKLKVEEAEERLCKVRHAAGASGKSLGDDEWLHFLDDEWDNDRWEDEMRKQFGETYYAADEGGDETPGGSDNDDDRISQKRTRKPKLRKPKWDDDIDIKDLVPDFEDDNARPPDVTLSDLEEEEEKAEENGDVSDQGDDDSDEERPSKKRKTANDRRKDRLAAKKSAKQTRSRIEALVDAHLGIDTHDLLPTTATTAASTGFGDNAVVAAPAATTGTAVASSSRPFLPFRYRETSPHAFGLTDRDILLAPSDAALNEFAGIKKLASFRPEEKKRRDRKRLGKKARLRQWRRDVFGAEYERTGPTYGLQVVQSKDGEVDARKKKDKKVRNRKRSEEAAGV